MDDISKSLGISKKTLYATFNDKNEIVDSLCELILLENIKIMEQITTFSKDPIHEMIGAGKHMSSVFSKINPVFFYDLKRFYPSAWIKFENFKHKDIMNMVQKNMKLGIAKKLYRSGLNIKIMSKYRVAQFDLALDQLIFPPDIYSLAQMQVLLLDHFLHGITTIKGHKLLNKYKQLKTDE